MIDPRLTWFAIGATCSAVVFGWPWHPRFSRYSRMQDPDWRRSISHENINRPSGPPPLKLRRTQLDPPEQFIRMNEGRAQRGNGHGGPSTPKPGIIPCGTRSITFPNPSPDRQPTNPFTGKLIRPKSRSPRIFRKDFLP